MGSVRSELIDLSAKIQNIVDMFNHDNDMSEFADSPEAVEKLFRVILIIDAMFLYLALAEDLIHGEITPKVFLKRWEKYTKSRAEQMMAQVDSISPEVMDFIKRAGGNDSNYEGEGN